MAEQRLTPEEQLLKLIEKDNQGGTGEIKRRKRFSFTFSGLKGIKFFLGKGIRRYLKKVKAGLKEPNLKVINKTFLILSVVLLGYSIISLIFGRYDMRKVYKNIQPIKEKWLTQKVETKERPYLHYLEMARRRNIFSPIPLKEESEKPKIEKKQLQEIMQDLKLVGISWGKESIAMVESKKEKRTYFLKKGDNIGQFKISDILEDRVILDYKGELIELM